MKLHLLSAVALAGLVTAAPAFATTYAITDLGTATNSNSTNPFYPSNSSATSINNSGQVVGHYAMDGIRTEKAYLYSGGTVSLLGTLGGNRARAFGINDAGDVVGVSRNASATEQAFLYSGATMTNLGSLIGSNGVSQANGINNSGQVVGWTDTDPNRSSIHAFLYSGGVMQDLGTFGGSGSAAMAINSSGQVAGSADNASGQAHAFVYSSGTMTDLGTLGGQYSSAAAINNAGQVAGTSSVFGSANFHAFFYNGGAMIDIGTLGGNTSNAYGINNLGDVVGSSRTATNANSAFIYRNGVLTDLNSLIDPASGWVLTEADDINDQGQIVGIGNVLTMGPTGQFWQQRAFLLTAVPVPAAAWLFGSSLFGLIGLARGRRTS